MWAIGEQIMFALWSVVSISIELRKGLEARMSLNVWVYLLLPNYITDTFAHLQSHSSYLFCVCALLEARIWVNKRRIPELFTEKLFAFFQGKCLKIETVRKKAPCALLVHEKYYISCTSFEGPPFLFSIIFSEHLWSLFCILIFFFLVVGLTGMLLFRSCIPKAFIKVF